MKYINVIIYLYILVIVALVLYQIFGIIKDKNVKGQDRKIRIRYKDLVEKEILRLKKSKQASKEHLAFLEKQLVNTHNLVLFESVLSDIRKKDEKLIKEYCISISSAFQQLSILYRKKNSLQKAYFTYLLSLFPELIQDEETISYAMMHFVMDDSVYCRENAMLFFYHKSDERLIISSLKKMSKRNLYYSPKLLADDLLEFQGDQNALAVALLNDFDKFNSSYQLGIINYLRFSGKVYQEQIYHKYITKKYSKEVRLAIIRYFATHKYDPFEEELLKIIEDKSRSHYEYRLVASFALASYDNKRAREVLIDCLCDVNFYVRKNAAISLSRMKLTKSDIEKLKQLEDPYAQDMIRYIFAQAGGIQIRANRKDGK